MTTNHTPAVNPITGKAYKKVSVNVALSRELQATRAMRDAANATNTRLLAQRDELVAALRTLQDITSSGLSPQSAFYEMSCAELVVAINGIARAALAKAKE